MDARYERQIKRGVLEMLVLELICRGRTYGYAISVQLGSYANGLFRLREGTLYPILYRLEDDGLIRSDVEAAQGRGAAKRYYEATPAGHETLRELRALWTRFSNGVQQVLQEEKTDE